MGGKTIAVLTSGGDAPGMNAAVRAVTRYAIHKDMKVLGVRRGFTGLISGDFLEMNLRSVSDMMNRGGTILYTARTPRFLDGEGIRKACDTCKILGIDYVVVIGGEGSLKGAYELSKCGVNCVGIPGTIDNDVGCTEYTIGFDTAMNTATEMVDKVRDTAHSHERCSIVEVMGRNCGELALYTGIAVGAMAILIPEVPFDIEEQVINRIKRSQAKGKKHFIIIVSEGVGNVENIAKLVQERMGFETRVTILGHVQRGGSPTLRDRVIASQMGHLAVDIVDQDLGSMVVAMKSEKIVYYDMESAIKMKKEIDRQIYKVAMEISI